MLSIISSININGNAVLVRAQHPACEAKRCRVIYQSLDVICYCRCETTSLEHECRGPRRSVPQQVRQFNRMWQTVKRGFSVRVSQCNNPQVFLTAVSVNDVNYRCVQFRLIKSQHTCQKRGFERAFEGKWEENKVLWCQESLCACITQ